jgi:hypothetical protein
MKPARFAPVLLLAVLAGCGARSDRRTVQTLETGVVRIAVTSTTMMNTLDPEEWMYRYAERLGRDLGLRVEWHVVTFDKSWELAGKDVVDVVATNLASFPDRVSPGGTFSAPFLYEQRALRIRAADRSQYHTIADFVGRKVGAVRGMAAERDLLRRAPSGVRIVSTATFPELYDQFGLGQLDGIAQAEYFTLDGRVIPSYGPDLALIDHHDLNPGQREESVSTPSWRARRFRCTLRANPRSFPRPYCLPMANSVDVARTYMTPSDSAGVAISISPIALVATSLKTGPASTTSMSPSSFDR